MSFHENLRYYREQAGYTTKELANLLNISANTYAGYEIREREPKYQMLCKIADLLKISTDELLGHSSNAPKLLGNKDDENLIKMIDELLAIANNNHKTDIQITKIDNDIIYFKNNNSNIKNEYHVNKQVLINALNNINKDNLKKTSDILAMYLSNTDKKLLINKLKEKLKEANLISDEKIRLNKINDIINAINAVQPLIIDDNLYKNYFKENDK